NVPPVSVAKRIILVSRQTRRNQQTVKFQSLRSTWRRAGSPLERQSLHPEMPPKIRHSWRWKTTKGPLPRRPAGIDHDRRPVHRRRVVGGKEHSGTGHLLG